MRRRRNPADVNAWWIFGVIAGASALVAGIAYAASSTTPAPSTGATPPPSPTPTPTTPAPTSAPLTQLVTGQQYTLYVTCPSPATQPNVSEFPFLAGATVFAVAPSLLLNSATWKVDFKYAGPNAPVPSPMPSPGGCTATLSNYSNPAIHNVGPSPSPT